MCSYHYCCIYSYKEKKNSNHYKLLNFNKHLHSLCKAVLQCCIILENIEPATACGALFDQSVFNFYVMK